MRFAIVTTYAAAADADTETLWRETALAALRAGHQLLVSLGPQASAAQLDVLRQHGGQLQQRPRPARAWTPRRRKQTRSALASFAPHAVLVVQASAYDIAAPEQAELREALLQERFAFVLLCPAPATPAPTAKLLRNARAMFSAAALCGFDSAATRETTRTQLNIDLPHARLIGGQDEPAAPAMLSWLQSIAGRRNAASSSATSATADATTSVVPSHAVHMFWHGPPLSRLERLCMSSFLAHGHEVWLHAYQEPQGVPPGVQIKDANRVLSERYLFRHEKSGSVAAFADWFRYVLLHQQGGLWVDTDVVCLKPLRYAQPIVFGRQDEQIINNAVLKLPPRHELAAWMIDCCEFPNRARPYDKKRIRRRKLKRRLFQGNSRGNIAWGENGPQGFTQAARHLGYDQHALPFWHFYPVHFLNWRSVFDAGLSENMIADSHALHLWNEMVRRAPGYQGGRRFDPACLFEQLCTRYLKSDS